MFNKVAIVDAVASDLTWIGKLFQIVCATKLKARREMFVGAKLQSGICSKSVADDLRLRGRILKVECTLINTTVVLSV